MNSAARTVRRSTPLDDPAGVIRRTLRRYFAARTADALVEWFDGRIALAERGAALREPHECPTCGLSRFALAQAQAEIERLGAAPYVSATKTLVPESTSTLAPGLKVAERRRVEEETR